MSVGDDGSVVGRDLAGAVDTLEGIQRQCHQHFIDHNCGEVPDLFRIGQIDEVREGGQQLGQAMA